MPGVAEEGVDLMWAAENSLAEVWAGGGFGFGLGGAFGGGGDAAAAALLGAPDGDLLELDLPPQPQICVLTYEQANQRVCVLEELQPTDVVMYDPDVAFVRQIERYQATARSGAARQRRKCTDSRGTQSVRQAPRSTGCAMRLRRAGRLRRGRRGARSVERRGGIQQAGIQCRCIQ